MEENLSLSVASYTVVSVQSSWPIHGSRATRRCSSSGASTCSRAGRCSCAATPDATTRSSRRSSRQSRAAGPTPCRGSRSRARLAWLAEAPEELLGTLAEIDGVRARPRRLPRRHRRTREHARGVRHPARAPHAATTGDSTARRAVLRTDEKPWVGCQFPTPALAQDAGMGLTCVRGLPLRRRARRLGSARRAHARDRARASTPPARCASPATAPISPSASTAAHGHVDAVGANMPGGEVFYSPVEDSAEGTVTFSEYPACYGGRAVENVRLRFEGGRVVDAIGVDERGLPPRRRSTPTRVPACSASSASAAIPGIQRHTQNTLFDEKIEGTIHLALGNGFPFLGGTNVSAVHWDMVKDLRRRRHDRARRRGRPARRDAG